MTEGPMTKHQHMARSGHLDGFSKGGHAHMHEHHPKHHHGGHKEMHHDGGHVGHHSGSIHHTTSAHEVSTSHWDTEEVGTDGGGKHESGGGTGGTRNRI